jgi:hypothetical protein
MRSLRRFATVVWIALALLVGQQAVALHDLGHATGQLSHKQDSKSPASTCDQCFACAELSGAVGASVPDVPVLAPCPPRALAAVAPGAGATARLAYRSRAPPSRV